jgi:site-specific DNA recombinase
MKKEQQPTIGVRNALYARVSSDQQAQEGTIDSQVSLLRERIAAAGGGLDEASCFIDDGVSGSTLVRPGLERLRDQAAAGAIDRLYVLAPDRLARRHAHQMVLVEELQACGVELVFVNRPLGMTPEDQLLLQVQGVIAEYERAKILERTRRGRLHAARCGRISVLGQAPYGYRYLDKHARGGVAAYEVVADEAEVVRQIFAWVGRDGCSLAEVARRLEQLGVPGRHGQKRWNRGTIWGMLKNPAYRGQAGYGKTRRGERRPRPRPRRGQPEVPKRPYSVYRQPATEHIGIAVPALVDVDLFAVVQERLEENRRRLRQGRRGPGYLLQGLMVCAGCGYAICGRLSGASAYYFCPGSEPCRFGGQRVCSSRRQRTEDLEAAVWKDVCELLSEPQRLRQEFERRQENPGLENATADSERLAGSITKVKQGISRLLDVYTEGLVDKRDFEPRFRGLKERLAKLESDLQTIEQRAQQTQDLRLVYSCLEDFADQMKAGLGTTDWSQKREILRALVKRVEVDKEAIRIVYKVPAHPFAKGPKGGQLQDCRWRWLAPTGAASVFVFRILKTI